VGLCVTTQGLAREWDEEEFPAPTAIEFQSAPSDTGVAKRFDGTSLAIVGKPTVYNGGKGILVGRILKPRITLTKNPDGTVLLAFDHVAMSGDHEHSGTNGYFTGSQQRSPLDSRMGGLTWKIAIYDAGGQPLYTWDWLAANLPHEDIYCSVTKPESFSTVIGSGGTLSPHEVFSRAAKVGAVVNTAEWTHCS